ncbi:F-box only protein 15 isoform X5 [Pongo pygmaeus]|uniref:F-box only protein 15 isoform X5 n=1 Tax=Pongo pygmaeus TaxID=9600 RepID=UPI00300D218E
MATGRGRILQQHWLGLQTLRGPSRGGGAARGRARAFGFRKGPGVKLSAGSAALRCHARGGQHWESSFSCCSGFLDGHTNKTDTSEKTYGPWCLLEAPEEAVKSPRVLRRWRLGSMWVRMPSEILLKIFSYLDAVSLLCTGCVSRRFYHLANDNFIWIGIYSTAFSPTRSNWKVNSVEKIAMSMSFLSVQDKEAGYWKKEYITKQIASVKAALADILKPVNPYTGLPVKTKEALRIFGLGWAIILKEKNGKEYIMEHADLSINDTSVTVIWYGKKWPCLASLSTLDLCGMTPVFTDWYKTPTKHRLRWHSLIAKYDLSHLTVSTMIGCDRLIRIFCLHPGLLVGVWKKEEELAFVMANLHFHHLVERSTLGSATIPYELPPHSPFLDDSPEYGLHGYQLHVDLHSGGVFFLCGTFRNLFTKKAKGCSAALARIFLAKALAVLSCL